MAQTPIAINGGSSMWAITSEERIKYDKQFDSLKPVGGYITGDQARTFFLQSSLPSAVLAEIWALSDLNKDGKMDQQEFSIAMKLIKLKLQGQPLPAILPPTMKQSPTFCPLISARFGMGSMPNLSIPAPVSSIAPLAPMSSLSSVTCIPSVVISPSLLPSVSTPSLPNGAPSFLQPSPVTYSSTLPHSSSYSPMMGGFTGANIQKTQSLIDLGSSRYASPGLKQCFSSNSSSTTSLPGNSPKTGFVDWAVPQASRLKYRQKFNSLDKGMSGYLSGLQAKNVLLQSNLSQTQLATIWSLADTDGNGQLRAEEFILAMHLIDMAKAGQPLPLTLPPELVPPSLRSVKYTEQTNCVLPVSQRMHEEELPPKPPVTFEDKRKANYERGNMELEKRRQVILEQQQREAERKAQKEREAKERREREQQELERKKQLEQERQLEKQRQLKKQKEEEMRKEAERREAAKKELERQQRLEREKLHRQDLLNQRNREKEEIAKLASKKKSLDLEINALKNKHQQISGKLQDVQKRKQICENELDVLGGKCDLGLVEIKELQCQFQEYQDKLILLVPEKQHLNERVNHMQLDNPLYTELNSLHEKSSKKEELCQRLKEEVDALEKATASKLSEINAFNNQLKDLRETCHSQQLAIEQLHRIKQDKIQELERKRAELKQKKRLEDEAIRKAKREKENLWQETIRREEEERRRCLQEERMQEKNHEEMQKSKEVAEQERESLQQKLTKKHEEQKMYKPEQILKDAEQQRKKQKEDRRQEEIVKEAVEKSKWFEEKKKRKHNVDLQDLEKTQLNESNAGILKQSKEQNRKSSLENEDNAVNTSDSGKSLDFVAYRALYPFEGRNHDEISFNSGDIIQVVEKTQGEPDWLYGSFQGHLGWFPSNYVEKIYENDFSPAKKALLPPTVCLPKISVPVTQLSPGKSAIESDYHNIPSTSLNANTCDKKSAFIRTASPGSISPIHGQGQVVENIKAQALCSWTAKKDNHLNFSKDDVITVLEQQENWWFGETNGRKGWFPKSYVKILPEKEYQKEESEPVYAEVNKKSGQPPYRLGEEYISLYSYTSSEPGDLTFTEGEEILVTRKEGDWWTGCIGDRTGIFPSNYVRPKDYDTSSTTNKTGTLNKKPEIAQVTAVYTASGTEQLSLAPGQLILILKKNSNGWWQGELQARGKKRQKGWFPATHVKLLGPNNERTNTAAFPVCQVIAIYDYTANNEDELSFCKGQLINVLNKEDVDWWQGEINGISGLFPSNYVKMTTDCDPSQQWCADLKSLETMHPMERKRQGYIHELIQTEEKYMDDLQLVLEVFQKQMAEAGCLSEKEMGLIFVNWKELIASNTKLLKALRVRKKTVGEKMPVHIIGDILTAELSHMQAYIQFCSCQLKGASLLQQKTDEEPEFKEFLKKIASDPRCQGMPLSSFLLKPMQRITRYPLLIKSILENTMETHPDYNNLKLALECAELLCSQVNEGVREKENSDRLEWIQSHVLCEGLTEQLVFNSLTKCLGPRKLVHSGKLYKTKSSKELWAFLFSDFLLLTYTVKQFISTGSEKLFSAKSNSQFKMYKSPVFLNEVLVKLPTDPCSEEPVFHISHIDRVYTLKTDNVNERTAWIQKIKEASEHYIETEKRNHEQAYQARSQKTSGIGRLMVHIIEATELKACKLNGKSSPYCEISMESQSYTTRTLQDTLNPKWNYNCQFFLKDIYQDVLSITVFDRNQFSPDELLGHTEVPVAKIRTEQENKGPTTKHLLLHGVPTGEVCVRFDLQLFDQKSLL